MYVYVDHSADLETRFKMGHPSPKYVLVHPTTGRLTWHIRLVLFHIDEPVTDTVGANLVSACSPRAVTLIDESSCGRSATNGPRCAVKKTFQSSKTSHK